ncbi:MAG: cell division ATP-binding protein FtsE [Clostridia bacterium]|nr:cell division ATP-binding protein FtsE [Clostridia bacterium]
MIEFKNVSKEYKNGVRALNDVSFRVDNGEFVFLIGQSGAGKSSIIKLFMCEERPTSGQVFVDGVDILGLKKKQIPFLRRSFGVVFQDFRLLPKATVFDNVAFAMQVVGASPREIRRRVPEVLSQVGLAARARSYPHQLSGGEQQRVCVARAIVNKPSVLLADEPTGNLDNEIAHEIVDIFNEINRNGTTILMATHADWIVNSMQKRVITMEHGRIAEDREGGDYHIGNASY